MILFQSINQPYEFAEPDKKIQTGYSTKQIHSLPATKLKEILKKHQVQNNNVKVAELRDRVLHLQTKGLVGLPRGKKTRISRQRWIKKTIQKHSVCC
mmetsp:Transcript_5688/g.8590  ORF Transcript_5688/g.8590 Transcript_5688/m.8590 type:complete len:97 (-) Transcript_5688:408-698(-)